MLSRVLTYTAGCGDRALEVYAILGLTEIMDAGETAQEALHVQEKREKNQRRLLSTNT